MREALESSERAVKAEKKLPAIVKYELVCEPVAEFMVSSFNRRTNTTAQVARFMLEELRTYRLTREHVFVIAFDVKCNIIGFSDISEGTLTSSLISPRDVFQQALATARCHSIIVCHNHPSGDLTPSKDDIRVTERLKQAGEILDIPLLDHIIVGDNDYSSMRELGYL